MQSLGERRQHFASVLVLRQGRGVAGAQAEERWPQQVGKNKTDRERF